MSKKQLNWKSQFLVRATKKSRDNLNKKTSFKKIVSNKKHLKTTNKIKTRRRKIEIAPEKGKKNREKQKKKTPVFVSLKKQNS